MKNLKIALTALAISALPVLALAGTYQYVDVSGNLRSVEANSPTQAIAIAPNIASHSGVMLAGNSTIVTPVTIPTPIPSGTGSLYQYIDISGNLRTVRATSASMALATAPNIASHSGVMLIAG
jgi:hypothetical protein